MIHVVAVCVCVCVCARACAGCVCLKKQTELWCDEWREDYSVFFLLFMSNRWQSCFNFALITVCLKQTLIYMYNNMS